MTAAMDEPYLPKSDFIWIVADVAREAALANRA
jgi:hypothetical protein